MSLALDAALNKLLLEQEYGLEHGKSLREWAMERLRMEGELFDHVDLYVKLRVALSLCPVSALTHRRSERLSRAEKIENFLLDQGLVTDADARALSILVGNVIDSWLTERVTVTGYRDALVQRDGTRCNACRVDLAAPAESARSVVTKDPYKLAWVDAERSFAYTVDHKVPVSKFGTNQLENLELLCRYCNEGKEDGSPLILKHEVELATVLPATGEPALGLASKSARLIYRVLKRDAFLCASCGGNACELTVRKVVEEALAVTSNLRSRCFDCDEARLD